MSRQYTILFDIDGTLLRTGGAGMLAINQTFREMFQIENEVTVPVRGRTDYGILGDLFRAHQINFDDHYRKFSDRYHELLPDYLPRTSGELLPGVVSLLERLAESEFRLGIVTGNARLAAKAKLDFFGLQQFFAFGGYGDDSGNRDDVARAAVDSAIEYVGADFDLARCWVIGDTPADVRCARSVGVKAAAVLTGGYEITDFDELTPDLILRDLYEFSPENVIKRIQGASEISE